MSDLIAVTYPDEETARRVRDVLIEQSAAHTIELADLVIITRNDAGKVKLHQARSMTGAGAAGGALWGTLIGFLFLAPLLGAAVGAAAGAAGGALTDVGIDDQFMKELGKELPPGSAALLALVISATADKVLPQIARFGGHVLQTSLSNEAESSLQAALSAGINPAAQAAGS